MVEFKNFPYESMSEGYQRRFEQIAEELGDFPALRFGERIISYKELNHRATQLAHAIQQRTDAQIIITWLSDELLSIATMLAIAKLGRVWVIIHHRSPAMIIAQYITKFANAAFFTNQNLPDELQSMPHKLINYEKLDLLENPPKQSNAYAQGDYLQIVPAPSSSAVPNGVVHTSEAVSRNIYSYALVHEIERQQQVAFVGDPSFAANLATVQSALVAGATLHIFNLNQMGLADFHSHLREHHIASIQCVTSVFRLAFANVKAGDFPDLRLIRVGGEAAFKSDLEMFKANFAPSSKFINGFGSSEMGGVSFLTANHDTVVEDERLPVGQILPYLKAKVINEAGEAVIGEEGEMVFYDKLLQNYWGESENPDGKFFTDPQDPEWKGYRSGDYGILFPDGNLMYLGRRDTQVKVRGQRVEIAAIEHRIRGQAAVAEVLVQPYQSKGETRLVAYLVAKTGMQMPNENVWRIYLGRTLSDYMIPSRFIVLDKLPRLPDGKPDLKALPDPVLTNVERKNPFVPANTERETQLLSIWQDILDFKGDIGIEDSFFDLGGSSLQATALISELNERFNVVLTPAMLYQYPNIRKLATFIDDATLSHAMHPSIVPFRPFGTHYPIFCLPGALGNPLAFKVLAHRLERDFPVYGLQMQGLDAKEALPRDLDELLAYYELGIKSLGLKIPIYLMGLSVGGVHAFELARRLQAQNIAVEAVILLDTFYPGTEQDADFADDAEEAEVLQKVHAERRERRQRKQRAEAVAYRIRSYGERLASLPGKVLQYALLSPNERKAKWEERQKRVADARSLDERAEAKSNVDMQQLLEEIRKTSRRTAAGYRPTNFAGNVFYIRANQNKGNPSRAESWEKHVQGKFSLLEVDAPHALLNIAHVDKVVKVLKEAVLMRGGLFRMYIN